MSTASATRATAAGTSCVVPDCLKWTQQRQESALGEAEAALLADPARCGDRFRLVLMSVIIPVNLCSPGAEAALGNRFHPGRYRGIAAVRQPDGGELAGVYRPPEQWFPRRLWRATGSLPDAGATCSADGTVFPDPGINLDSTLLERERRGGNGHWGEAEDCQASLRGTLRIADLAHRGHIDLRSVEVLRFTGQHRTDSMDFLVAQLALEAPHAQDLVAFRQSLRTGAPTAALRPPTGAVKPYARMAFDAGPGVAPRTLSASELLEYHVKVILLEHRHYDAATRKPDHAAIAAELLDAADPRGLNLPQELDLAPEGEAGRTSVTFAIRAGHTRVRSEARQENDASDRRRLYTTVAALPVPGRELPACPIAEATALSYADPAWTRARQWGLLLSTGADTSSALPPDTAEGAGRDSLELREGWADYVTGWGMTTIRTEPDSSRYGEPLRLAQTRDVDLAVLAMRQLYGLEYLAEAADALDATPAGGAAAADPRRGAGGNPPDRAAGKEIARAYAGLTRLNGMMLDYRKNLWFGHVPRRPMASAMLQAMQDRLDVPAQLAELTEDLTLRHEILSGLAGQQKAEAAQRKRDREERKRTRMERGLAVASLLVAVPSFTGAALEPSAMNFAWTAGITLALALVVVILGRHGKLTCFFNRLLGISEADPAPGAAAAAGAGPGDRNRPAG